MNFRCEVRAVSKKHHPVFFENETLILAGTPHEATVLAKLAGGGSKVGAHNDTQPPRRKPSRHVHREKAMSERGDFWARCLATASVRERTCNFS